ncbi:MAG TPA: hypothetical protein VFQ31_05325 [Methyloceanibacter sp.]|nr:hypothetical protein [Methyloceanibacter sp.]
MIKLWILLRGGFLRSQRAQALGVAAGIGGLADALSQWADLSMISLIRALSENWALIAGGFGVATLGAKIDRKDTGKGTGETVSDIAGRALRR